MAIPSFTFGAVLASKRERATIKIVGKPRKQSPVHPDSAVRAWAIIALHRATYFEVYLMEQRDREGTMIIGMGKRPMLNTLQEAKDLKSLADLAHGDNWSFEIAHSSAL